MPAPTPPFPVDSFVRLVTKEGPIYQVYQLDEPSDANGRQWWVWLMFYNPATGKIDTEHRASKRVVAVPTP